MHRFDYELWPSTHVDGRKELRLYNGSKFHIRHKYLELFPDLKPNLEIDIDDEDQKVYKIQYTLNLLPNIDESVDSLMEACGETDELEIFECEVLKNFIEFKWN